MVATKRPRKRRSRKRRRVNEAQPVARESVIAKCDDWHDQVIAGVAHLIEEEVDGLTCITTPDGRACHVHVWFKAGGSA